MFAFDTETTGTDMWHGCLPFFFAFCFPDGTLKWVEWDVDPFTRTPEIETDDLDDILALLSSDQAVAHNANFDLRAIERAFAYAIEHHDYKWTIDWDFTAIQDTMVASHALRNLWSHSLKSLREVFLMVDDHKQNALRQAVNQARRICRTEAFQEAHGVWRIADANDPHWPGVKRAPSESADDIEGWWLLDSWLPKAIWLHAPEFLPSPETCVKTYDNVITDDVPWQDAHWEHPWRTVCRDYALEDVETTLPLWGVLEKALCREDLYACYEERLRLNRVMYEIQDPGIHLLDSLPEEIERYETEARRYSVKAEAVANAQLKTDDFNLNSSQQLQQLLYSESGFNLPVVKLTDKGNPSTDADALDQLVELVSDTLVSTKATLFLNNVKYKKRNDTASRYLCSYRDWADNGYIHTNITTTGTKFTRQSSKNPNMQNVGGGKEDQYGDIDFNLRTQFGPEEDYVWIAADYSNIELRIWGYQTGNKELIRCFEDDYSVHLLIARELHASLNDMEDDDAKNTPQYKKTKNGNFSILYGAAPRRANKTYDVKGAYEKINKRLPEVKDFTQSLHKKVEEDGYIETLTGYRLYIPTDQPHVSVSGRIQGTAGAIIGRAMVECADWLREQDWNTDLTPPCLILQVHDELVFQIPKHLWESEGEYIYDNLTSIMERQGDAIDIPLPVHADLITTTWADGETIKN